MMVENTPWPWPKSPKKDPAHFPFPTGPRP